MLAAAATRKTAAGPRRVNPSLRSRAVAHTASRTPETTRRSGHGDSLGIACRWPGTTRLVRVPVWRGHRGTPASLAQGGPPRAVTPPPRAPPRRHAPAAPPPRPRPLARPLIPLTRCPRVRPRVGRASARRRRGGRRGDGVARPRISAGRAGLEPALTTIGLIGAGNIGSTVARLAVVPDTTSSSATAAGRRRSPTSWPSWASTLARRRDRGGGGRRRRRRDHPAEELPRGARSSRCAARSFIDTNNYYPERDGHIPSSTTSRPTTAEMLQAHLPESQVVKTSTTSTSSTCCGLARPSGDPERSVLAIAGDDAAAKRTVTEVLDSLGYDGPRRRPAQRGLALPARHRGLRRPFTPASAASTRGRSPRRRGVSSHQQTRRGEALPRHGLTLPHHARQPPRPRRRPVRGRRRRTTSAARAAPDKPGSRAGRAVVTLDPARPSRPPARGRWRPPHRQETPCPTSSIASSTPVSVRCGRSLRAPRPGSCSSDRRHLGHRRPGRGRAQGPLPPAERGRRGRGRGHRLRRRPRHPAPLHRARDGQAVQQLFPEAKLGIGPPVTDGFYYDFDVETPFVPRTSPRSRPRWRKSSRRVSASTAASPPTPTRSASWPRSPTRSS